MLTSGEKKKQGTKERKGEGGNYDKGDVSNPRGKEEAFFYNQYNQYNQLAAWENIETDLSFTLTPKQIPDEFKI